jgi:tetratricopeptide (TPR) repeat protein
MHTTFHPPTPAGACAKISGGRRNTLPWMAGLLLLTLICYAPVFSGNKEFTNWDDPSYITEQPLVTSLSTANISKMFDPATVVAYNYHPLTMLSLAIDYQLGYDEELKKLSIAPFVRTNIFFHLLNTLLVFLLVGRLSKGPHWVAALCALLFGIHPLHVESVAWISERKDVLYCCFFLLSLLAYLRYMGSRQVGWLGLSVLCFITSCLCKAMAVPLPFVLLLTDYLYQRRFRIALLLEKLPYLAVSIIMGVLTLRAQAGAMGSTEHYTLLQRLLLASAAYCQYLLKLVVPVRLAAYYPYPDAPIPALYYAALPVALLLFVVPMIFLLRRRNDTARRAMWGIGFFVLMIALVLPMISVGSALMADRYTYVSSIGLFFGAAVLLEALMHRPRFRSVALAGYGLLLIFYAVKTYQRIPVWDNSGTLWADVIAQYPMHTEGGRLRNTHAKTPYKNIADYYVGVGMYDSAYTYYQVLAGARVRDAEIWSNLGNIYLLMKEPAKAIDAFDTALTIDSTNADTWMTRAVVQANTGDLAGGIKSLDKVVQLNPADTQARAMRADMQQRLGK